MRVRIDHLDANPFRHIDRYPIREDKIAALRESITTTGFWDNLVGRQVGDRVQIAYGHHRREALIREYPSDYEVGIVVRDFTDEQMLQIMARENMEEWGSSAMVELETVRAVVEAHGDGAIELPDPRGPGVNNNKLRWAPSFVVGGEPAAALRRAPYTVKTVTAFLSWDEDKVGTALGALALIEDPDVPLRDEDFFGLGTTAARALVEETRRAVRAEQHAREEAERAAKLAEQRRQEAAERAEKAAQEREKSLARARAAREKAEQDSAEREYQAARDRAKEAERKRALADRAAEEVRKQNEQLGRLNREETRKVSQAARQHLRSGGGTRDVRSATDKVRRETREDAPRDLDREIRSVAAAFENFLTESTMARRLNMVLGYRKHMSDESRDQLIAGLTALREDIDKVLKKLGATGAVNPERDLVLDGEIVVDAEVV